MFNSSLSVSGAVVDEATGPQEVSRLISGCHNWFFAPAPGRYIALRNGELSGILCVNYAALINESDCNFDPCRRRDPLLAIAKLPFEQNSAALLIEVHSRCSLAPGAIREIARILGASVLSMTSRRMPETMAA